MRRHKNSSFPELCFQKHKQKSILVIRKKKNSGTDLDLSCNTDIRFRCFGTFIIMSIYVKVIIFDLSFENTIIFTGKLPVF